MSDFTVTQALTADELKQYNEVLTELNHTDEDISKADKDSIIDLLKKRSQLEDEIHRYHNLSLSRLSGDKTLLHDFEHQFTDIIIKEPVNDEKILSQKLAAAASDFYCKKYPDKVDLYKNQDGETLTEYVDRLLSYQSDNNDDIETIKAIRAKIAEYPIDKFNHTVWNLMTSTEDGQIGIYVGKGKGKNKDKEAIVIYSINFSNLTNVHISKHLTSFDKRVYIAFGALFRAGNRTVSLTQVAYAMGYVKNPSDDMLSRISDSVIKMNSAQITIDNQSEVEIYKNYPLFRYQGSLLPLEKIDCIINGKLTDSAINIFREPPMITYAKEHKQITTVKVELLQSPLRKTELNLKLEDYIIEQISHMKKGTLTNRMLFNSIYTNIGITDKKQRQRTPAKIYELLDYYKKQNWIKEYTLTEDKTGIDIEY